MRDSSCLLETNKVPLHTHTPAPDTNMPVRKMMQVILMNVCHRLISLSVHTMEIHHAASLSIWMSAQVAAALLFASVLHVEFDLLRI